MCNVWFLILFFISCFSCTICALLCALCVSKENLDNSNASVVFCGGSRRVAIITNCDTIVAICDLSQFVIKALTWHIDSNNTENVFCVFGRVPMFTFDMNMKSFMFADFGVISLVHLFVCLSVIKPIIDVPVTFLIGSDVDVNIFSALRSIPSGTFDINLKSCILNRHKLRESQIATLPSQFVICHNL